MTASSPPPHTHDRESEGGKEAQRRTGAKITAAKIRDTKTTQRNFTDTMTRKANDANFFVDKYVIARDATLFEKDAQGRDATLF